MLDTLFGGLWTLCRSNLLRTLSSDGCAKVEVRTYYYINRENGPGIILSELCVGTDLSFSGFLD